MSEVCFHCKRSLNKKFKVKVGDKSYCGVCYTKLKNDDKLKSQEPVKKEEKCKCGNGCCEKKAVSKTEQMANDFIKTFREYNGEKIINIDIADGLITTSISLKDQKDTAKKTYENKIKTFCPEEPLKEIIIAIFEQQERENKFTKELANQMLEANIKSLQEQIEKNKKEM